MSEITPGTSLSLMVYNLREDHRIKLGTDYAVTQKYKEIHLLCAEVFLPTILEEAERTCVTFKTTHTYPSV